MMTEERKIELTENYSRVMEQIHAAVNQRGTGAEVSLLAASKTYPAQDIAYLMTHCGLTMAGENRQTEFTEKYEEVHPYGQYHFIGHLQTNKVKYLVGKADLIHSVDSVHLAEEIARQSVRKEVVTPILVQVNAGREEAKSGIFPEEAPEFLAQIAEMPALKLRGMMVVAPICEEKSAVRKYFQESYRIFIDFFAKNKHNIEDPILSMGMSDTFAEAIMEGATLVRVGSALFGARNYQI
ncbi:MAG: YggS family pyridoxal phosphate-dependent enzyme [Ruminococcaceae bacterium]|nr:YggS family pyridoxal phosphate-dependent enzyme [Oscillospiraceae bacterium]